MCLSLLEEARGSQVAELLGNLAAEQLPSEDRQTGAGSQMDGNLLGSCIRPGSEEAVRADLKELAGGELSLVRLQGSRLEVGGRRRGCYKEMVRVEEEQNRWACQHVLVYPS